LAEALGGDGVMGRYLAEVPVVQIVGTMARAGLGAAGVPHTNPVIPLTDATEFPGRSIF
jgi:hypothetical protein